MVAASLNGGELVDFLVGTILLVTATAAYCHVIRTLRGMHNETIIRLKRLEQMLNRSAAADDREGRLDTIREVSESLNG